MIRVSGFQNDSIVDGPGLRFTLFVQGCEFHCPGCHNPDTQSLESGKFYDADAIWAMIDRNPILTGVTFSGGEPLLQAAELLPLAEKIRAKGLELAIYTGYTWEEIYCDDADSKDDNCTNKDAMRALLRLADTIIDGRFILAQRSLTLRFKGSRNQRIIDVAKSLDAMDAAQSAISTYAPIVRTEERWGYSFNENQ
ncbi:MAG: radical SAM protein [Clostridiales Family XIII bacterium]|jgi:anaerobic ribonucleoside-triphosphate reductase activating protein|nr:radical SAM protein [Clostridiales Family XIII bacterium]